MSNTNEKRALELIIYECNFILFNDFIESSITFSFIFELNVNKISKKGFYAVNFY